MPKSRARRKLTQLAWARVRSLGELVRQACERQYRLADRDARLSAVEELAAMRIPVGPVERLLAESVAEPQNLPRS